MTKGLGKHVLHYSVGLSAMIILLDLSVSSGVNLYNRYAPYDHFFEYSKTESLFDEYPVGAPFVKMRSTVTWKRNGMKAVWTDVLKCHYNDERGWVFEGSKTTSGNVDIQPEDKPISSWKLNIKLPERAAKCKVSSLIEVSIGGFVKRQTIDSGEFAVAEQQKEGDQLE